MHPSEAQTAGSYAPMDDQPYDLHPAWSEKQASPRRSKWLLWGAIGVGAVLILGGVIAGIVIGTSHKSNSNNDSNNGGNGTSGSSDPSKFDKNPNLKNSFYGFAYTPIVSLLNWHTFFAALTSNDSFFFHQGAILPDCGANISTSLRRPLEKFIYPDYFFYQRV